MEMWMIRLINMSVTAGCAALIVLALRLVLQRLPKGYFYGLWLVVLFRFLCPVAVPSPLSLIPVNPEPVGQEILYDRTPKVRTGIGWMDERINRVLEEQIPAADPADSVNPMGLVLVAVAVVWEVGAAGLAVYFLATYVRLKGRLRTAVRAGDAAGPGDMDPAAAASDAAASDSAALCCRGRIYESDQIGGAFVLGIFRPAVYLPAGLCGEERGYILAHEDVHIRRRDYVFKLVGLAVVVLHWFNPFAWVTFSYLCRDMEMSCDEQVVRRLGMEERKPYSMALLKAAERRSGLALPPYFGESHTRARIANILRCRKYPLAVTALLLCGVAAVGAGLATSRRGEEMAAWAVSVIGGADGPTSIFLAGKSGGGSDGPLDQMPDEKWLAGTKVAAVSSGNQTGQKVALDLANENSLIFHGDFGLFSFGKVDGRWRLNAYLEEPEAGEIQYMVEKMKNTYGLDLRESIGATDRFTGSAALTEYAAARMADGRVAILGDCTGTGRLIDLFYGYYDPEDQVMHQVYLFIGDGKEITNLEGEVTVMGYQE